ncbi:MAG: redoxin domain-containing protein [Verrucomicrobia bacterium]|nr:redoxin domain-containing protein [Verrucomicrobiota bacterium]MDE3099788.1 redoxin domain-containing protein [Verrucomicrobiota bacterium]
MKNSIQQTFAALAVITLAGSAFAGAVVGRPAPNFTATDIAGKTVHLSDYKGKVVVLESYNQDCPFCHNQYKTGAMQALQRDLTAKDVVWLIVDSVNDKNSSYRSPQQASKDRIAEQMAVTDWLDDHSGAIGHLYGMQTTPDMFVINKDGILVYAGAIDNRPDPFHNPLRARNYVREAVNDLLAGKAVAVPETKPYGCSVKYAD